MPATPALTIRIALQQLRNRFHNGSHEYPNVWHFVLRTERHVTLPFLNRLVRPRGLSVFDVNKQIQENGLVDYSCFAGSAAQFEGFKTLAEMARKAFVLLLKIMDITPHHTRFSPLKAWMADMHMKANKEPTAVLRVTSLMLDEWLKPIKRLFQKPRLS